MTDAGHMPPPRRLRCLRRRLLRDPAGPETVAYDWPDLDERGALAVLHLGHHRQSEGRALYASLDATARDGSLQPDCFALSALDAVMPIAPMFHANAWSLPYCTPMVGAKLVLPGRSLATATS